MSELLDRADAVGAVVARVRGLAGDRQAEAAEALAGRLEVAARRRRLDHERTRHARRRLLEERAGRLAALLLVRGQEDPERAARRAGQADRLEQQHETRLHVVRARAVRPITLEAERDHRQRAQRPDRVRMPEQEQRLARAVELGDEVVALVQPHVRAQRLELDAHPLGDLPHAR